MSPAEARQTGLRSVKAFGRAIRPKRRAQGLVGLVTEKAGAKRGDGALDAGAELFERDGLEGVVQTLGPLP